MFIKYFDLKLAKTLEISLCCGLPGKNQLKSANDILARPSVASFDGQLIWYAKHATHTFVALRWCRDLFSVSVSVCILYLVSGIWYPVSAIVGRINHMFT